MARAKPKYSIITTCKGRLDHLKQTLPSMLAQKDSEVIVVDYSCPHGTAEYVRENFKNAKVIRLENIQGFSTWRGRNAGAEQAEGEYLIFCDADTKLSPEATKLIGDILDDKSFGFFMMETTEKFVVPGARLSLNQLKGFHAIPAAIFREMGGYDTAMTGYAAGADTDIEDRMRLAGYEARELNVETIEDVIQHGDTERVRYHRETVGFSYAAGLWYRRAKLAMMLLNRRTSISPKLSEDLAKIAKGAATRLIRTGKPAHINVVLNDEPLRMPVQLGLKSGRFVVTLKIEIVPGERLPLRGPQHPKPKEKTEA